MILAVKKLLERFMKKNSKRQTKQFNVAKAITKKLIDCYVKWKDCDNSFHRWIDKRDIVQMYII